jgi:hypothetical protein
MVSARILAFGLLLGCDSSLGGAWTGDCEFEDLVGPDGRFMELIYRLELDLESDGIGALTGSGSLYYTVDEVDKESGFSLSGESQGDEVQITLVFDEELNDLLLEGEQYRRDQLEGDCSAGVAEGEFRLLR